MDLLNLTSTCCGATSLSGQLLFQLFSTLLTAQCQLKPNYPPDKSNNIQQQYDFIVIGAGSAGSAVTAGLVKANPQWNILLIEAGDDPQLNSEIPALFYYVQNTTQDWQYKTVPQQNACHALKQKQCPWPRGKTVGGTSAFNAMIYNMGNPDDYNEWSKMGIDEWSWDDVKPFFDKQIQDDIQPQWFQHSSQTSYYECSENTVNCLRYRILEAGRNLIPYQQIEILDVSQGKVGAYQVYGTVRNGTRNNAARIYLTPIADAKNLNVIKNSEVIKIEFDSKRAVGVQVKIRDELIRINVTKEVIVSAGAINTPKLLMQSGIGPKDHLNQLNIPVVQDLPVGNNLHDHPAVVIPVTIRTNESNPEIHDSIYNYWMHQTGPLSTINLGDDLIYINSNDMFNERGDISFNFFYAETRDQLVLKGIYNGFNFNDDIIAKLNQTNYYQPIILIYMTLLHPKSRGQIRLTSDPSEPLLIDPSYYAHQNDTDTALKGIRFIQQLLDQPDMHDLQPKIIDFNLSECKQYVYDSDQYWLCIIKYFSYTLYHPVGTASINKQQSKGVVDKHLKVHGIEGLRVADASVMPKIVGGNTNAPCMMIGSRAAQFISNQWKNIV